MTHRPHIVAIGGLGGSGTRLIASVLEGLGFYIGSSLNDKLDNLWFTLLFKRPAWFAKAPAEEEIAQAIDLFRRAMEEGLDGNVDETEIALLRELMDRALHAEAGIGVAPAVLEEILSSRARERGRHVGWGWKEPNTNIFLPQIAASIPDLKYVHVIRNGFDMAFSPNQQQLMNWSAYLGEPRPSAADLTPHTALDFWIRSNRRVAEIGKTLGPGRFHMLNYDRFCSDPMVELRELVRFLDVRWSFADLLVLSQRIAPVSIGRYKKRNDVSFGPEQIEAVSEFGFSHR